MTISPMDPGVKELICSRSEYLDRYTPKNICRHIQTHTRSNKINTYRIKLVSWLKSAPTNKFFEMRPVSRAILSWELQLGLQASFEYPTTIWQSEHHSEHRNIRRAHCVSLSHFMRLARSGSISVVLAFILQELCFSIHPKAAFFGGLERINGFSFISMEKTDFTYE